MTASIGRISPGLAQPLLGLGNTNKMLFGRLAGLFPEHWDSVILSATHILVCWSLLYLLHRKKIYLKVSSCRKCRRFP